MQPTNPPAISLSVRQQELRQHLRAVQARLGTSAEQPTDFAVVQELAHRLNNLYMTEGFRSQVSRGPEELGGRAWNQVRTPDPEFEGSAG